MSIQIAETAVVDPRAHLEDGVEIGPYCVIGPDVVIGEGTRLDNNVTLMNRVTLGRENHLSPFSVIGGDPQDLSFQGTDTQVLIGDHNVIREHVTINRGSEKEEGVTTVGSHCYLMIASHVAHDCIIGDHVMIANGTMMGGHVRIQDNATISGGVCIHHFATIGSFSFVGGASRVTQDVPPFMLVEGFPAKPRCVNVVALKRGGFNQDTIKALSESYRLLYRSKVGVDHARDILRAKGLLLPHVTQLFSFLETQQEGRHGRARDLRRAA